MEGAGGKSGVVVGPQGVAVMAVGSGASWDDGVDSDESCGNDEEAGGGTGVAEMAMGRAGVGVVLVVVVSVFVAVVVSVVVIRVDGMDNVVETP